MVFVTCDNQFARLDVNESNLVSMRGLHFVGCGGNKVSNVETFTVEDTIFQGVEGGGTALLLSEVATASIIRTEFLFNGQRYHRNRSSEQNEVDGGALNVVLSSTVSIASSKFVYNEAHDAGAILVRNSTLHVTQSNFSCNTAKNLGGVVVASDSLISIENTGFSRNTAGYGGVMLLEDNSFIMIDDSTFINNRALYSGGVIYGFKQSSLNITRSIFTSNSLVQSLMVESCTYTPSSGSIPSALSATHLLTIVHLVVMVELCIYYTLHPVNCLSILPVICSQTTVLTWVESCIV